MPSRYRRPTKSADGEFAASYTTVTRQITRSAPDRSYSFT